MKLEATDLLGLRSRSLWRSSYSHCAPPLSGINRLPQSALRQRKRTVMGILIPLSFQFGKIPFSPEHLKKMTPQQRQKFAEMIEAQKRLKKAQKPVPIPIPPNQPPANPANNDEN